jgi:hypothetical protein
MLRLHYCIRSSIGQLPTQATGTRIQICDGLGAWVWGMGQLGQWIGGKQNSKGIARADREIAPGLSSPHRPSRKSQTQRLAAAAQTSKSSSETEEAREEKREGKVGKARQKGRQSSRRNPVKCRFPSIPSSSPPLVLCTLACRCLFGLGLRLGRRRGGGRRGGVGSSGVLLRGSVAGGVGLVRGPEGLTVSVA